MKHGIIASIVCLSGMGCSDVPPIKQQVHATCASCALELEFLIAIGSPDDPGGPDAVSSAVATDQLGRWYIADGPPGEQVLVYSRDGQYIRSIGRAGRGPGELTGTRYLTIHNDTLHVFSAGPRYSRFALDGSVVTAGALPVPVRRAFVFSDSSLLVYNPSRQGSPLHQVRHGRVIKSFGPTDDNALVISSIAAQSFDRVWLADRFTYRVLLWGSDDRVHRTLERQPPWFRWPQEAPKAVINDVWLDSERDWLWVSAGHVLRSAAEDSMPTPVAMVEVINLADGSLIAADSLVGVMPLRFTSHGDLFEIRQAEAGHNVVSVWRPRVRADSLTSLQEE
jgi:hypothetical protein